MKLDNAFEKGQVYVALSRGISMNNIEILTFDRSKIEIDERVRNYHKKYLKNLT